MTAAAAAETYGIVEMLAGDAGAAERELASGYRLLEEIGETQNFPDLAAKLADALYVQGRDDRALELSEVSEAATAPDDRSAGVQWRAVRAKLLAGAASWRRPRRWRGRRWCSPTRLISPCCAPTPSWIWPKCCGRPRETESTRFVALALELYEQKGNVVAAGRARRILDA